MGTLFYSIKGIGAFYELKITNFVLRDVIEANITFCVKLSHSLWLGTLGSLIEFKYIVALTNETQIILSFLRIFKFNVFKFNKKFNVLDLRNCT
jgi:hypothetical protein